MKMDLQQQNQASRLRNFILEFFSVFFIVGSNGTFLILILFKTVEENFDKPTVALLGFGNLLFTCIISTCLIYLVKGRLYSEKIKEFCNVANRVADGDFNVRIPEDFKKPKSEMDFLTVNFNKMLVEISSLENMKNDFVADVSHEIKTPLSVVQGYADLLQNKDLSDEKRTEYTFRLSKAIESLSNLVTNILKLNKIENQGIIKKERFSLDEQLRCCILTFEDEIEDKKLNLNIDLADVFIFSDKSLLELVWNNLISNAIKYTKSSGTISVKLKKENSKTIVSVKDTGCGMSGDVIEHCYEKFYQGDTSHSQEGNGLGLALVKRVVDMLEGKIEVESTVGKGTEFLVIL